MNDFEQQIRRGFDHMFEEIPVPPANVAFANLERRRRRKRRKQYLAGGISIAAAAGLLALALFPRAELDIRGGNVVYDPNGHPGNRTAVVPADTTGHSGASSLPTNADQAKTTTGNGGVQGIGHAPGNGVHEQNDKKGTTSAGSGRASENAGPPSISPVPGNLGESSRTTGEEVKTPSNAADRVVAVAGGTKDGGIPSTGAESTPSTLTETNPAATSIGHAPGTSGTDSGKLGMTAQPSTSGPVVSRSAKALRWTPYTPNFIPPNYEPVVDFPSALDQPAGTESGASSNGVKWTYRGPNGEILVITQQPVRSITGIPLPSPTSPYPQEQTTVHGQVAVFEWDGKVLHLIWVEGDTRFDIATNTDKQTLLQVADGLAPSPSGPQQS